MKKIVSLLMVLGMALALGCGAAAGKDSGAAKTAAKNTAPAKAGKSIVVYFSATGNTRKVAETASKALGAELLEIKPAQPYTEADLDYNNENSRVSKDHKNPKARPAVANQADLSGYDTVVVAYPIWWGKEPPVVDTFMEHAKVDGKNMIALCTAFSSQIGSSGEDLAKNVKARYLGGRRFEPSASVDELTNYFKGLGVEK
jgi:flavodoxin